MTYQNSPNMGGEAETVEKGEATERRSIYPGTCPVRSAGNKMGFLLLVLRGGGVGRGEGGEGGEMPLFAEEEAAWPVPAALLSGGPADAQEAGKEKTNPWD